MDEDALRKTFAGLPRVAAAYVRDPSAGDPEVADVVLYVEVDPPYRDAIGSEVRAALLPIIGEDAVGGTHVQSAAHPHAAMLVGATRVYSRGT